MRALAPAPVDLAGFHYRDPAMNCIACHGGADLSKRLQVWTLAGFDTLKFLAGHYGEPTTMQLPLRDADCRVCHTPIVRAPAPSPPTPVTPAPATPAARAEASLEAAYTTDPAAEGRAGTSYHTVPDHDAVDVRCVRCHTTHTTDSDAPNRFISRALVRPVCLECHPEM